MSIAKLRKEDTLAALISKMMEETVEFRNASERGQKLEELADIVEIIRSLILTEGMRWNEVESRADAKRAKRGGFVQRLVLLETSLPEPVHVLEHEREIALSKLEDTAVGEGVAHVPFLRLMTGAGPSRLWIPVERFLVHVSLYLRDGGIALSIEEVRPRMDEDEGEVQAKLDLDV